MICSKLAQHIDNVHNKFETFKCDFCEQMLTNKDGLQNYIRRVHNFIHFQSNQCDVCSKLFDNKYYLQHHKRTSHDKPIEIIPCEFCSKTFNIKSQFKVI